MQRLFLLPLIQQWIDEMGKEPIVTKAVFSDG